MARKAAFEIASYTLNIYNYIIHHSNKQNIRVRMWMYKTRGDWRLYVSHPFLSLSLQSSSHSRSLPCVTRLELTLEILELHSVISVSGIRCGCNVATVRGREGKSHIHAVHKGWYLRLMPVYARTHAEFWNSLERKIALRFSDILKVTDHSCVSYKALEIVFKASVVVSVSHSDAPKVTRPALYTCLCMYTCVYACICRYY